MDKKSKLLDKIVILSMALMLDAIFGFWDILFKSLAFYGLDSEPAYDFMKFYPVLSNIGFFISFTIYLIFGIILYRLTQLNTEKSKSDLYFYFILYIIFYMIGCYSLISANLKFPISAAYLISSFFGILLSVKLFKPDKTTFIIHSVFLVFVLLMVFVPFIIRLK